MKQQSLASQAVFEKYGRKSRRELFLEEMERIVPWSAMEALVRPHYAKAGNGRQPVGLSIMLRTYFVQQWFNLSDPGVEEALYESAALRRFVGVDLGVAPAPDETTVCRFGGRQAPAARPTARRRAQGVGRRRLSGPDGGDPRGRAIRARHDLPQDEVQKLCGRRSETKEHN